MISIIDKEITLWGIYNEASELWEMDSNGVLYCSNRKGVVKAQMSAVHCDDQFFGEHQEPRRPLIIKEIVDE